MLIRCQLDFFHRAIMLIPCLYDHFSTWLERPIVETWENSEENIHYFCTENLSPIELFIITDKNNKIINNGNKEKYQKSTDTNGRPYY